MVLLEFSMAPRGHAESLSADVARVIDVIDKSGLPYQLTAMGTIIEGEWSEVLGVVTACFEALEDRLPAHRRAPEGRLPRRPQWPLAGQGGEGRGTPGAKAQDLRRPYIRPFHGTSLRSTQRISRSNR